MELDAEQHGTDSARASKAETPLRVLLLCDRYPFPLQNGQNLRVWHYVKRLRTLDLWKTRVDDRFVDRLCSRKFLTMLKAVGFGDTLVTPAALARLKKARPELEQHYSGGGL